MSKPVYLGLSILELSIHKERRHLHIAKDVETRFDNLNQELDRPLPKEKIKK